MSEHSANLVCQIGRKPTKSLANSTTRQLPGVNLDNYDPRQQIGFSLRGFLFGVIIPLRFNAQEFLILRDDPKLISILEFQQI
jgi:hypothetical protein